AGPAALRVRRASGSAGGVVTEPNCCQPTVQRDKCQEPRWEAGSAAAQTGPAAQPIGCRSERPPSAAVRGWGGVAPRTAAEALAEGAPAERPAVLAAAAELPVGVAEGDERQHPQLLRDAEGLAQRSCSSGSALTQFEPTPADQA